MSVSSNSRKESTESHAARRMNSTMGMPPEISQLRDRSLENELPSRRAGSADIDVPSDFADAQRLAAETDDEPTAETTLSTDEPLDERDSATQHVPDANVNRSTNEPDRTFGHS